MSKKAIATRRSEAKVAGRRFEEAHGGVSFEEAEAQQAESMRRALAHKVWFGLVWVGVNKPSHCCCLQEKLLEFDRTSAARSRVYDDQVCVATARTLQLVLPLFHHSNHALPHRLTTFKTPPPPGSPSASAAERVPRRPNATLQCTHETTRYNLAGYWASTGGFPHSHNVST